MNRLSLGSAILLALTLPVTGCHTAPEAELAESDKDAQQSQTISAQTGRKADTQLLERMELSGARIRRVDVEEERAGDAAAAAGMVQPGGDDQPYVAQDSRPAAKLARRAAESSPASNPETALASPPPPSPPIGSKQYSEPFNREGYADLVDNAVMRVAEVPVSTFSIDVDTGSYSNVRRMIEQGQLPPSDAVRAEELINYFDYGYQPPASLDTPFSVSTELAPAPWNSKHVLMQIGIKGYEVPKVKTPASNIVFLIDTSGSMQSPDKIDLLKAAFKQMLPELRAQDRVSIVVYAGAAGLVLAPTPGDQREVISAAFDAMSAGGSTNGAAGIELAYQMAEQNLIPGGINRVILATDGDFNVGTVSVDALKTLIAGKRKSGIALTTLGFGQGNYQDEIAEQLADVGNGNHAYIDSLQEARKVLVEELGSTLLTIAKDVKIQVEFNPAVVSEYRLIGYENRVLRREDFNNDKIDAGEIGAGHDVTAIYELTLVGSGADASDALRYAKTQPLAVDASGELAWLKLRYKLPESETSILIDKPMLSSQIRAESSDRLAFAAAVAAYADLLRGGSNMSGFAYSDVLRLARRGLRDDERGYRHQFLDMVQRTQQLSTPASTQQISMQQ
ncbi:MAG: VWA domain-containing protein [Pseudomonadota bacterium]|nr:VWA domain-containing protein [Pseudomonadota bacterium]